MPNGQGDETQPKSIGPTRLSLADFDALEELKNADESGDVLLARIEQARERRETESLKLSRAAEKASANANEQALNFNAIADKSPGGKELKQSRDEIEHERKKESDFLARSHEIKMQIQRLNQEHALAVMKMKHERVLAIMKALVALLVGATGLVGFLAKTERLPAFLTPKTVPKICPSVVPATPSAIAPVPTPIISVAPPSPPSTAPPQHSAKYLCSYKKHAGEDDLDVSSNSAQCARNKGNGRVSIQVSGKEVICQCP